MYIKSELKEICLKLAMNSGSDKGFLLTSYIASGLYTCIKSLKMCIKSDFEEIILKLATYGQCDKEFLLTSKFCRCLSCPWAIYLYKSIKMYTRTRCQVSIYRTTGPLVSCCGSDVNHLFLFKYSTTKQTK